MSSKSILIVLLIITVQNFPQSEFEEQYTLVNKLYSEEQYFDAITEAKRLMFFDKSGEYEYDMYFIIGNCYKRGAKFTDAINYFSLAELNSKNGQQWFDAKREIIKTNILRRTTHNALKLIDSLLNDKSFSQYQHELLYWKGWAFIFDDKWDSASVTFAKIDSTKWLSEFTDSVANNLYSENFAKIISYIIPGAGQIYTGEVLSGLLSLGWNILWGYTTVNAIIENRIFDAVMVANFLWLRFYQGNLQNAEKFAQEKNLLITNEALRYLQYTFNGLKPDD